MEKLHCEGDKTITNTYSANTLLAKGRKNNEFIRNDERLFVVGKGWKIWIFEIKSLINKKSFKAKICDRIFL